MIRILNVKLKEKKKSNYSKKIKTERLCKVDLLFFLI
jgi:hypothetical protein